MAKTNWLILFTLLCCTTGYSQPILKISLQKPPGSAAGNYLISLYSEVARQLGVQFEFKHYPHKRSNLMLLRGEIDGDSSRVYEYKLWYPQLIQVSEPHYTSSVVAVASRLEKQNWNFADIVRKQLTVCYHRGSLIVERRVNDQIPQAQTLAVASMRTGLKTLYSGRCDLFIGVASEVRNLLMDHEFANMPLYITNELYPYSAHMYLVPAHKELAKKIGATLKTMKESGQLKEIMQQSGLQY